MVKTIGDEVMFSAPEVAQGAEIALQLAEAFADDELLGDVRVGLACGRVLEVEGDLYGPAVNLASRIVSIAYPGTVLVSDAVAEVLQDDPRFLLRPIRPHHLRHIGRVRLWVLRRSDEASDEPTLERARARRRRRRELIAERMADRIAERAAETAGEAAERAIRRMLGLPDPDEAREMRTGESEVH
ncbi:MAG: hypothetical protein KatS3mg008_1948 [Acidimicrobiales bacterium]|nr:MAG: hypothetical protein KatS3mg008_1948 [Acidimicrobiales bacterium]